MSTVISIKVNFTSKEMSKKVKREARKFLKTRPPMIENSKKIYSRNLKHKKKHSIIDEEY